MEFLFVEQLDMKSVVDLNLKQEIIDFLIKNNAGSPKIRELDLDGKIYVFNNVLNFNQDAEYENVRTYIKELVGVLDNELPFARDGFGNVYLIDLSSLFVKFYEHENGDKIELLPFDLFIKKLGVK